MNDRTRLGRRGLLGGLALAVVLLAGIGVSAEDPCEKQPDLWFPAPGVVLSGGVTSIQEISGDVCQGGTVTITVTIDNLSCGNAGPFDVTAYWDSTAHPIQTKHVDGLPGCEFVKLTFTWDTDGVPPGSHTIIVRADTGSTVAELNESNNEYTFDVLVRPNTPMLEASKRYVDVNEGTVNPGDTIRYEVEIVNDGCEDLENGSGHEFVDELPGLVEPTGYVQATSGTAAVVGTTIVWDGSIPAGGSATLIYRVIVSEGAGVGTEICNQGHAYWDESGDGAADASEPTDDPTTPEDDDPTCFTVEEPIGPIPLCGTIDAPSLSEWGAIALTSLLAVAFGWTLRRRRATA
jgi:uncharacterized repeat protein (TIGR01451 family)